MCTHRGIMRVPVASNNRINVLDNYCNSDFAIVWKRENGPFCHSL